MCTCAEPSKKAHLHDPCICAVTCDTHIFYLIGFHSPPFFLLPLPFGFPRRTEYVRLDLTKNFFNESKIHIKFCGNKKETTAILFLLVFSSQREHLLQIICITWESSSSKTSNVYRQLMGQTEVVKKKSANNKEEVLHANGILATIICSFGTFYGGKVFLLIFNLATDFW